MRYQKAYAGTMMQLFHRPDGRYYAILPPSVDLLGDLVLMTFHGSTRSRMGGVKTYVGASGEALQEIERQVILARKRHGYLADDAVSPA